MYYLLRILLILMLLAIGLTMAGAMSPINLPLGHIQLAIIAFLYTIFIQAFVMFYFIGVNRLIENIYRIICSKDNLEEIFYTPPKDIDSYRKKTAQLLQSSRHCKRQTIPWTMLILTLGSLAFLLGGAYDTGLVARTTHLGVVYGLAAAMLIGTFHQWRHLGTSNRLLRKIKALYQIPNQKM